MGFVTTTGFAGEAIESLWGYILSQMIGPAKVVFRCRAIFSNVSAICDNLLRLSSAKKTPPVYAA